MIVLLARQYVVDCVLVVKEGFAEPNVALCAAGQVAPPWLGFVGAREGVEALI